MKANVLRVYGDIAEAIGCTPMIRLNKVTQEHNIKCQVYAKCEFVSPGGSIKDRIARTMINEAQKRGDIKPGDAIVDSTSGNTGIGLNLISVCKGYKTVMITTDKSSSEKIELLRHLGAQVIVADNSLANEDPESYQSIAERHGKLPNHYYVHQHFNYDNPLAHLQTTSIEIWEQMEGKIDYVFACTGTCGTIMGTGKGLHNFDTNIKIIGVDPVGSILARPPELNSGIKPYKVEGLGQKNVSPFVDYKDIYEFIKTDDQETFEMAREVIRKEGLLLGGSAGATVIGCFKYLKEKKLDQDANLRIVLIFPDGMQNYISKFATDEWMVGNGFYPPSVLQYPDHPLASKLIANCRNLKPVPYYDSRLTVYDCFDLFKKGLMMIPIRADGEISGVVTQNSLARNVIKKRLSGMNSVSNCTQAYYFSVAEDTPLSLISLLLQREVAVLVIKKENAKIKCITVVSQDDILEIMNECVKGNV